MIRRRGSSPCRLGRLDLVRQIVLRTKTRTRFSALKEKSPWHRAAILESCPNPRGIELIKTVVAKAAA